MPALILVAEDNVTLRWIFVQQLEELGFQSDCAGSGDEAISRFKKSCKYQLVLMDIKLIGKDGYEATKQIRDFERLKKLKHVPIIAITGIEDRDSCLAAGMNDYYQKPILPEQLKEIVDRWLPKNGV